MKKLIASVLAAASVLSLSAVAFAADNDKAVTKPGDLTYEVTATSPKIVLDLVMPAKMTASLNPYGAEIVVYKADSEDKTATNGILSVSYEVTNNSTDYGVYLDATAITTVNTSDKTKWEVKAAAPTAGTKSAQMALLFNKAQPTITSKKITFPTSSAAMSSSATGALVLDSTVAADKTNGIVAGQTSQKKLGFVAAKTDSSVGKGYMVFVGELAASSATVDVAWTEDDSIGVNLVLKVVAGPKTLPTS